MLSWSVSASAEPRTTVVDSLVWDIQQLERELVQCGIMATATEDSLEVRLRVMGWELAASRDLEAKWYQSPILHFLFGCAAATLVIISTVQFTL